MSSMIHLRVSSLAGDALAVVDVSTTMSIAELRMQITRKVDMEGCRFVQWLTHGSELLEDDLLLLESNLCDGDELVATCTSLAVGVYQNGRVQCLSGEWEDDIIARVTLSVDGSAAVEEYDEYYHNSPVFCDMTYVLGDVMYGPDCMEVPVDFMGACRIDGNEHAEREIRWQGTLHIDAIDPTTRRLSIPDMDWNMFEIALWKRCWDSIDEFEFLQWYRQFCLEMLSLKGFGREEEENMWHRLFLQCEEQDMGHLLLEYEYFTDIDFEAAFEATDYSDRIPEPDLPKASRRGANKSPKIKDLNVRIRACEDRERHRRKRIRILREKDRKYSRDKRFDGLSELACQAFVNN